MSRRFVSLPYDKIEAQKLIALNPFGEIKRSSSALPLLFLNLSYPSPPSPVSPLLSQASSHGGSPNVPPPGVPRGLPQLRPRRRGPLRSRSGGGGSGSRSASGGHRLLRRPRGEGSLAGVCVCVCVRSCVLSCASYKSVRLSDCPSAFVFFLLCCSGAVVFRGCCVSLLSCLGCRFVFFVSSVRERSSWMYVAGRIIRRSPCAVLLFVFSRLETPVEYMQPKT